MTRTAMQLAALASSAVPGLDPVSVRAVATHPESSYDVAFVTDAQHREWVVRAPRTAAAGAQADAVAPFLALAARRLPFSVPTARGHVAVAEGRVGVHPYVAGRALDLGSVPAGPGLAADLGAVVAAVHDLDRGLAEEAGLPMYDAEAHRARKLADLDRAAATGHVPTTLLARWERRLENVSLWRFAPATVHGSLEGRHLLVAFEDEEDAATGRVRAVTGWEAAKVADPAEDLAALVAECDPATLETVLEAYAHHRVERPDPHLVARARLAAEMRLLSRLLAAGSAGRRDLVRALASELRALDERTADEDDDETTSPDPLAGGRAQRWAAEHQATAGATVAGTATVAATMADAEPGEEVRDEEGHDGETDEPEPADDDTVAVPAEHLLDDSAHTEVLSEADLAQARASLPSRPEPEDHDADDLGATQPVAVTPVDEEDDGRAADEQR
ncbi:phosphotransferase [Lapillicoccus jejuensis]|uniref:phosphotransferase n=1 Tax=Lapillicoccus jejuensis TaxID=402171 RepID=UPI00114DB890|nr:phosphotransferase [Lapillicoccus jejuensis]